MNLHTLSSAAKGVATASEGALRTQPAATAAAAWNDTKSDAQSGGDAIDIAAEGKAKTAQAGQTAAAGGDSSLTACIDKLRKRLQQLMGSSDMPEDKTRSAIVTLRNQIQMLQSQQPKSSASAAVQASSPA